MTNVPRIQNLQAHYLGLMIMSVCIFSLPQIIAFLIIGTDMVLEDVTELYASYSFKKSEPQGLC